MVDLGCLVEGAIEEHVRNLGLLLYVVCERNIGRTDTADVNDEIGLEFEHVLEICRASATGEPAILGQLAHALLEKGLLCRAGRAHPADHFLWSERVEQNGCGRAGCQHTRYALGNFDVTSGGICDAARSILAPCRGNYKKCQRNQS